MAQQQVRLSEYNKAWVALIMAALMVAEQTWGFNLGINEEFVIIVLGALTPILVWLIPNNT